MSVHLYCKILRLQLHARRFQPKQRKSSHIVNKQTIFQEGKRVMSETKKLFVMSTVISRSKEGRGYHQFFNPYGESYRIKSSNSKLIRTRHEQRQLLKDDEFATPTLDVRF